MSLGITGGDAPPSLSRSWQKLVIPADETRGLKEFLLGEKHEAYNLLALGKTATAQLWDLEQPTVAIVYPYPDRMASLRPGKILRHTLMIGWILRDQSIKYNLARAQDNGLVVIPGGIPPTVGEFMQQPGLEFFNRELERDESLCLGYAVLNRQNGDNACVLGYADPTRARLIEHTVDLEPIKAKHTEVPLNTYIGGESY